MGTRKDWLLVVTLVASVLVAAAILSGCTTTTSAPERGANGNVSIGDACPREKSYSKAVQEKAVQELASCGDNCTTLLRFIEDYGVLRNQVRACRKQ